MVEVDPQGFMSLLKISQALKSQANEIVFKSFDVHLIFFHFRGIFKMLRIRSYRAMSVLLIVSQLSKCLKFMTFREGCFVIHN